MTDVRDDRWALINPNDPGQSLAVVRDILRDFEERLSNVDVNGSGLVIPDGFVVQAMLGTDSVGSAQVQADAIGTSEIAPLAVTVAELADNAVTLAKMADNAVDTAELVDGAVETVKIADDAVTKAKLAGGFLRQVAIAGGAAGALTVTGIASGDELVGVARLNRDAVAANIDLTTITSEFSITGADTISNAGGTDTTGDALLVTWLDLT